MSRLFLVAITLALAACAAQPLMPAAETGPSADEMFGYAEGYRAGRRDLLRSLDADPAFTREPASVGPEEVSWLPRDAELPTWQSRDTDISLKSECRRRLRFNLQIIRDARQVIKDAR